MAHGVLRREHQDRGGDAAIPEGPQHLEPRHARQAEIEHHEIVEPSRYQPQGLEAVVHQVGMVLGLFQPALDVLADDAIVFDDENLHPWLPVAMGRNTRKVAPSPGSEFTSIRPRCCSTMP